MKLLLILSFLLTPMIGLTTSQFFYEEDSVPIELKYIIKTLNSLQSETPIAKQNEIDKVILDLNESLASFHKAENYFILKTESYKAIYELSPGKNFESTTLNFQIPTLKRKFKKYKKSHPFLFYLIIGLLDDYQAFKEKNNNRASLSTPWLNFFNENDFDNLKVPLQNLMLSILQRSIIKFKFYKVGFDEVKSSGKVLWIKEKDISGNGPGVVKITEKVLSGAKTNFAEEFDFKNLSIEELFPAPDPSYNAPEKLPNPTNDWKD